jgi:hypothetical protein
MAIYNCISSSYLPCITISGCAAIELSSVFLAQKSILYYGIKISSIAQIEKSEHMWLMQFNFTINDK